MKTKLACTIGPSSGERAVIREIFKVGCRIFRINLSHGGPELWRRWAGLLREVGEELGLDHVLITDLRGPSVRFEGFKGRRQLKAGERFPIFLRGLGGEDSLEIGSREFFKTVSQGDVLVTDDGRGQMEVLTVGDDRVDVRALADMELAPGKSLVVRGRESFVGGYLENSLKEIEEAVSLEADFIGLSLVRTRFDVDSVREYLVGRGLETGLIAKVETPSAVANVVEIAEAADAVLVARGDLGMHYSLEKVPRLQKEIVDASMRVGRPVIVATQLLGSMMMEPTPSRSEIVDIMNCVEYGVDVLMLTGETAVGRYPVEAVKWLGKVVETYEDGVSLPRPVGRENIFDRFALGVVELAEALGAKIAVYTKAGNGARRISRYKPRAEIYAGSGRNQTIKRLMLLWGVTPIKLDELDYMEGLDALMDELSSQGYIRPGDTLVLTYGISDEPVHIIKIVKI
ncbi:Pyruvate kinase [archaeon HR01]|nr:Pyruvate kinase [archaeon HR01]